MKAVAIWTALIVMVGAASALLSYNAGYSAGARLRGDNYDGRLSGDYDGR